MEEVGEVRVAQRAQEQVLGCEAGVKRDEAARRPVTVTVSEARLAVGEERIARLLLKSDNMTVWLLYGDEAGKRPREGERDFGDRVIGSAATATRDASQPNPSLSAYSRDPQRLVTLRARPNSSPRYPLLGATGNGTLPPFSRRPPCQPAMLRLSTTAPRIAPRAANAVRTLSSTAPRRADITLEVDGVPVTVPQGTALIQACEKAGATIPRFCYHDVSNPIPSVSLLTEAGIAPARAARFFRG